MSPGGHLEPAFLAAFFDSSARCTNMLMVWPATSAARLSSSNASAGRYSVTLRFMPSLYGECRIPVNNFLDIP